MAITDATAIKFCNDKVRPAADQLAQAFYKLQSVYDEWTAQQLINVIPNSGAEVVQDEAVTQPDGRPIITGQDVNNIMNRINEIVVDFEAGSNAKLNTILRVAVNPTR